MKGIQPAVEGGSLFCLRLPTCVAVDHALLMHGRQLLMSDIGYVLRDRSPPAISSR
jgi:hypothetical protein